MTVLKLFPILSKARQRNIPASKMSLIGVFFVVAAVVLFFVCFFWLVQPDQLQTIYWEDTKMLAANGPFQKLLRFRQKELLYCIGKNTHFCYNSESIHWNSVQLSEKQDVIFHFDTKFTIFFFFLNRWVTLPMKKYSKAKYHSRLSQCAAPLPSNSNAAQEPNLTKFTSSSAWATPAKALRLP